MEFKQFAKRNVLRNEQNYFAYFLSTHISVTLFFSLTMFILHPNTGTFKSNIMQYFLGAEIIAYLFLFFFVFYSFRVLFKKRYKEFGILYMLGISRSQLLKMIYIEIMIISIAATISGIVSGLVFSKFFLIIVEKLLRLPFLPFYFPVDAILITFVCFLLLGLVVSFFISRIVREKDILRLIKTTKEPNPAPKFSQLITVFGLLLLFGGYALLFNVTKENLREIILIIIVMVVIATYLLFSQFSVFAITILKKNRDYYFRNINLIWISKLFYRIQHNASMYFIISITSTSTMLLNGASFALWENTLSHNEARYQLAFTHETPDKTPYSSEENRLIDVQLMKNHFSNKKIGAEKKLVHQEDESVYDKYEKKYVDNLSSQFLTKAHIYGADKRTYGTIMFLSMFLGSLFFVASGSFIYNKYYMDEETDKQLYKQLHIIGVTFKEMKKVVSIEIGILFLIPYIVATIHSIVGLIALQNILKLEVGTASVIVMSFFLLLQICYYLLIRRNYLKVIKSF